MTIFSESRKACRALALSYFGLTQATETLPRPFPLWPLHPVRFVIRADLSDKLAGIFERTEPSKTNAPPLTKPRISEILCFKKSKSPGHR